MFEFIKNMGYKFQEKLFGNYERCYTEQLYRGHAVFGLCSGYEEDKECVGCPYLYSD